MQYATLQMTSLTGASSEWEVEAPEAKKIINLRVRRSSNAANEFTELETNPEKPENSYMMVPYDLYLIEHV